MDKDEYIKHMEEENMKLVEQLAELKDKEEAQAIIIKTLTDKIKEMKSNEDTEDIDGEIIVLDSLLSLEDEQEEIKKAIKRLKASPKQTPKVKPLTTSPYKLPGEDETWQGLEQLGKKVVDKTVNNYEKHKRQRMKEKYDMNKYKASYDKIHHLKSY